MIPSRRFDEPADQASFEAIRHSTRLLADRDRRAEQGTGQLMISTRVDCGGSRLEPAWEKSGKLLDGRRVAKCDRSVVDAALEQSSSCQVHATGGLTGAPTECACAAPRSFEKLCCLVDVAFVESEIGEMGFSHDDAAFIARLLCSVERCPESQPRLFEVVVQLCSASHRNQRICQLLRAAAAAGEVEFRLRVRLCAARSPSSVAMYDAKP